MTATGHGRSGPLDKQLRKQWGAEVRRRRVEMGLSQVEFALKAGVQQTTVSRVERGMHAGTAETRLALARACGVEVYELFPYPLTTEAAS